MFPYYLGVTLVDQNTQANINWVSDLVVKALCGACTILLGVAVSSLQSMNSEIKQLASNVNALTVSSTVVSETQKATTVRIEKLETEDERIRSKIQQMSTDIDVLKIKR